MIVPVQNDSFLFKLHRLLDLVKVVVCVPLIKNSLCVLKINRSSILFETMAGRSSSKSLRTTLKQELSVTGLMQGKLVCSRRHVQVGIYLEECC